MIIGVLIVSLLAFALTNVFAKKTWQTFLSLIFGLIFVASLSLIVANLSNHFGMEKVTETKTEKIVSSADSQGADMLLYKALGNGKEKVYLYRTNEKQEKPKEMCIRDRHRRTDCNGRGHQHPKLVYV